MCIHPRNNFGKLRAKRGKGISVTHHDPFLKLFGGAFAIIRPSEGTRMQDCLYILYTWLRHQPPKGAELLSGCCCSQECIVHYSCKKNRATFNKGIPWNSSVLLFVPGSLMAKVWRRLAPDLCEGRQRELEICGQAEHSKTCSNKTYWPNMAQRGSIFCNAGEDMRSNRAAALTSYSCCSSRLRQVFRLLHGDTMKSE